MFDLVRHRIDALGLGNIPLIVEPQSTPEDRSQVLSLGRIESRPAVKLTPRLYSNRVEWGQDLRRLLAKAAAYISAPADDDGDFWQRWAQTVQTDKLHDKAGDAFHAETDLGLLIEIFAACALNPAHRRWRKMPAVRAFLDDWRRTASAG